MIQVNKSAKKRKKTTFVFLTLKDILNLQCMLLVEIVLKKIISFPR